MADVAATKCAVCVAWVIINHATVHQMKPVKSVRMTRPNRLRHGTRVTLRMAGMRVGFFPLMRASFFPLMRAKPFPPNARGLLPPNARQKLSKPIIHQVRSSNG